uniref:Variant surface glycoprotein 458 n=1 Tax=Trypanosoma brucei TaxID=5691 RepID=M4SY51_9TRYP|nr:variant surface glycoprotein 458 [Trypanosoma brucei]
MIKSVFSLVLVIISSHSKKADAAVGSGDAVAEFEALCKIVRLAAEAVTLPSPADTNWPALAKIANINMTVADKEWKQIFLKAGDRKACHDVPPQELKPNADWQEKWPLFKVAVEVVDKVDQYVYVKEMELEKLDDHQQTYLRPLIIPIAKAAVALTHKLAKDIVGGDKLTALEAAATLLDAVYGEHPKTANVKFAKIFVAKPTSNGREAAFEFGTDKNKVRSVSGTLACICYKDNFAGQTQVCKHEQDTTHNWTDASATMTAAHIDAILALCGKQSTETLTSETIRDALQGIRSKITTKANDGYIGPFISACSGTAAAGTCVKTSGYKDAADSKWQAILWVGPLLILQQKVAIREKRNKEADQINSQLNVELAKEIATRYVVKHTQAPVAPTMQQRKKEVNQHTAGCHLKNKTAEECPESHCNYDSENKKCKPKPGTETPAAEAEEENQEEKNGKKGRCTQHGTNQQACEKESNCKWDGKECKDSRFLVNNKIGSEYGRFCCLIEF